MKKLLVASLAVLLATPAFAAVQNVKVSGDIIASYLNRNKFDAGLDTLPTSENPFATTPGLYYQNVWATQTRVRIDADLTDNVSTTVRFINETVWDGNYGDGTAFTSQDIKAVDIDLAYVTLREFLYSPLTLTVGRQEIVMGNGFIIGGGPNEFTSGHYNEIANDLTEVIAVDGVKAVLDYKPLTLTAFWYRNLQTLNSVRGLYNNDHANSDVFGINANYQLSDPYNTVVEAYLFGRLDGKGTSPAINGNPGISNQDKNDTLYVPGLRVSTNPIKGLNVQGELAGQFGQVEVQNVGTTQQEAEKRRAFGSQLMANYTLPVWEKYKPAVMGSLTYVSGDKNGAQNDNVAGATNSTKVYTAWDQFSKSEPGGGMIYDALFPLSDMFIYSTGVSVSPIQDVTAAFSWSGLWSARNFSNPTGGNVGGNPLFVYQPNQNSGTVNYIAAKQGSTNLGNEYDANFTYNYTEDVTFGLNVGWFVWGPVFNKPNSIHLTTASQAIADVSVKF